jgi:hypothetical protein
MSNNGRICGDEILNIFHTYVSYPLQPIMYVQSVPAERGRGFIPTRLTDPFGSRSQLDAVATIMAVVSSPLSRKHLADPSRQNDILENGLPTFPPSITTGPFFRPNLMPFS